MWDQFKVVFVDQKDYFEFIPTNLKASIDEKWHEKILYRYSEVIESHQGRLSFVQGKLVNVNTDDTIEIAKPDGTTLTLSYDYLILATGFQYTNPIRELATTTTIEQRIAELAEFH